MKASKVDQNKRTFLKFGAIMAAGQALGTRSVLAQSGEPSIGNNDRVYITNEDSNTIVVIDPKSNTVDTTINLTSFDEDPRPPFRLVTAGVTPTHAAMIHKPLYHGCIDAHGAVPSPDGRYLAISGRLPKASGPANRCRPHEALRCSAIAFRITRELGCRAASRA